MKIKYILLILLFAVSTISFSQGFKGGVVGGINTSRIDNDGDERNGKFGLNAGAFVAREIIPSVLDWQLEMKYTSRGKYNIERDNLGYTTRITLIDLRYIELPLSLQYFINDKMQVGLGLSPDVIIRESYSDQDGPLPDEYDLRRFGITAFASFNYFVLDPLAVGIRFNYSAIPFYKFDAYAVRYRDSGWFHDVLSLNVQYYFTRN